MASEYAVRKQAAMKAAAAKVRKDMEAEGKPVKAGGFAKAGPYSMAHPPKDIADRLTDKPTPASIESARKRIVAHVKDCEGGLKRWTDFQREFSKKYPAK